MKNMPFLEHLVGSSTTDLYDAIFDADVSNSQGLDIFDEDEDADDDRAEMRSIVSQDDTSGIPPFILSPPTATTSAAAPMRRAPSLPRPPASPSGHSNHSTGRRGVSSPGGSPRPRRIRLPSVIQASLSGEIQSMGPGSPLSRLYTGRTVSNVSQSAAAHATTEAGIRRLEAAVENIKGLPVNKLKEEMKELQVCGVDLFVLFLLLLFLACFPSSWFFSNFAFGGVTSCLDETWILIFLSLHARNDKQESKTSCSC